MFVTISILLLIFTIFYTWYVKKKYSYWEERGVPNPKPSLILGNIGKMITWQRTLTDFFKDVYREYEGYSYVGIYNCLTPAVVLRDPDLISDLLIRNFDSFTDTMIEIADPIASIHPGFVERDRWKTLRREMVGNLTKTKIKGMLVHIEKVCEEMLEYLKRKNYCVKATDLSFKFTGDNVMACAYGLDGKSFITGTSLMEQIRDEMSMSTKIGSLFHTSGLFFPKLCKLFQISYLGKQVPDKFKELIAMVVTYREDSTYAYNDFANFLKESKQKNDDNYFGYAMSFFLDGFETSGYALIYTLLEVTRNPIVQETARKEVEVTLKTHNTVHSYEALKSMVYLDSIIHETVRKHTVIKFINRKCTKDFVLPAPRAGHGKPVTITKGTHIFVPIEAIHRDEKYFPNSSKFDPNRFFDEHIMESRPKNAYLGFGDGPRVCLGKKFAVVQMKMILVTLLLNFTLKIHEKTVFPLGKEFYHLSKSPKGDIWIEFLPRS
ncbi:hypothetical protein PPYR_04518 [Photinus pyralis]|uniref:Cytochrome P450 n=1 Tax=Photinus pyralis TaxID=7054 RepID=A0A5N4AY93_PHOPY|nr:cytochrome P450 6j1-like [Photinus pyralis]KAB0802332.1 hypothetical protein PPYR_04518 [Photinus pyralis]